MWNGPTRSPPGPCESVIQPETAIVLDPVFLTTAVTRGAPAGVRLARGVEIVYLGAAAPPTDRYMRIPTRLTSVTCVFPGAFTDAQTTEYRSPLEAFAGILTCTVTIVALPGPSRSSAAAYASPARKLILGAPGRERERACPHACARGVDRDRLRSSGGVRHLHIGCQLRARRERARDVGAGEWARRRCRGSVDELDPDAADPSRRA